MLASCGGIGGMEKVLWIAHAYSAFGLYDLQHRRAVVLIVVG